MNRIYIIPIFLDRDDNNDDDDNYKITQCNQPTNTHTIQYFPDPFPPNSQTHTHTNTNPHARPETCHLGQMHIPHQVAHKHNHIETK
mmetsp:Transcript_9530/g.27178  ORF Transcript_9530/g.27178 Transcript_9530/m.27178 type:complete len:87 (-) Transcript_9530:44-304(-)